MKIAIHHNPNSFSERWIEYCKKERIDYKLVNAFNNNIIEQLKDCDAFMWHHHHADFKDVTAAKKILFALEHAGIKVFPDFKTGWHFDDKVAQKYLLEAIGAPLVPSYVFYDKKEAIDWAKQTSYPKVFKLKGGAGATNVKLVKTEREAIQLINIAFGKGFAQFDRINNLKERFNKFRSGKGSFLSVLKGIARLFITTKFARQQCPEKGYIYFQEFIPNNNFDTRVVVVGGVKAAAEKRFVRENDFRASGSDKFSYEDISNEVIKISFEVANKLKLQSVAFDFVLDVNNKPLIIEISYGFGTKGIEGVPGYWDSQLKWHEGKFNPQEWMVDEVIKLLEG
ncbi:hypothetical protein HXZ60_07360 [Acinetobacter towneri]|uniref:ATP-grasp domain-containing protein n=1 Tax=Acinetobacter towneri TaxID=202956 RepID=UPI002574AA43|nr:hypothetical protein [Acinetobacter towneri]MDM1283392.1 hypothetical protein [Acinetobacter towneri]